MVAGMTVTPLRSVPPPLPSAIMSGPGVPSVEEFGVLVAEFADHGMVEWGIADKNVAEWAARRLIEARGLIEQRRIESESWHRQIDEWYSSVTGEAQDIAAFAEAALKAYALRHRKETSRATLKLPSMDVCTKSNPGHVIVDDEDAFLEWAKVSDPDAIRTKFEPVAAVIKASYRSVVVSSSDDKGGVFESVVVVDSGGEIVPGLGWRESMITASL